MTPHAHRGRPAVGVNAEPMGVQNLYIIKITTGFPWYIPISIFQMNKITRNKINTHIKKNHMIALDVYFLSLYLLHIFLLLRAS